MLTLSTGLSIGILAPGVSAASIANEYDDNKQIIRIAQVEKVVTTSELIKKFKDLFPNEFNYLNDSDFHMGSGHHYLDEETIRYDLSFRKNINGKQVYGNVNFVGEKLEIESFNYQPANPVDALFPAKVSKEKAKEVAQALLKKLPGNSEYELDTDYFSYYGGNQLLTDPIRYSFYFVRTKNKVPISDQRIHITVLGNGEVSDFYRSIEDVGSPAYDDVTKVLPKKEIISKIKENLSIDLQYQIDFDYQTGNSNVKLLYQPSYVSGVHALSGEWLTANRFSPDFPKQKEIEYVTTKSIEPKKTNFSVKDAKAFAEELLAIDSDKVKLRIGSIDERKNHYGQEVISIQYMYEYTDGGHGTSLELDKHTGEIIQYNDIKSELLARFGGSKTSSTTISSEEALNQAVKYVKQFSPTYLHNYSMPIGESYFDDHRGVYYFTFPRVVNGILVSGDHISVSVSSDGSLAGLNVNRSDIKNWPSIANVISKEKATEKYFEQLSVDLGYVKVGKDQDRYHLVYTPVFHQNPFHSLDANSGEWDSQFDNKGDRQVVSHPWAGKELNHLINTGILDVVDVKTFNANSKVTKGAAIELIMKSLTRFDYGYYPGQEKKTQSFKNINPDHSLFEVIERAVNLGILEKENEIFNLDEHLTREELAVWYIRTLGLDQAAKNQGIYKLEFADAKHVQAKNVGFVALAHSLKLLTPSNNRFNPNEEVTYAHLAVSSIRLAHEVYKSGKQLNYY